MSEAVSAGSLRRFGRYEALFRIASGGMAEVYAARVRGEAGFEKLVAVKRMLPQLTEDADFVTMFLDEARLAAHINSPHCVQTLDLGRADDGSPYLVMDLVVGVTLARILRWCARNRTPIPIGVAVDLLLQSSQGLHDAHEATTPTGTPLMLVHRDVSPQNILVGVGGRVRLTDFGVARAVMRVTQTEAGRIKGKYAYCSPEQLVGGAMDRRADVFSLGVVAWEVLSGQRLFVGEHPAETIERARTMPIPELTQMRSDVPVPVSEVVAWALNRDRESRPNSAREFGEALREAATRVGQLPERDRVAVFVRSAGGEALAKIQTNINRALSENGISEPISGISAPAASEQSAVHVVDGSAIEVPKKQAEVTTPSSAGDGVESDGSKTEVSANASGDFALNDASAPSAAGVPSSLFPPDTAQDVGPELTQPRKNLGLRVALVASVIALGLAIGAAAALFTKDKPGAVAEPSVPAANPSRGTDPGTGKLQHEPRANSPLTTSEQGSVPGVTEAADPAAAGDPGPRDRVVSAEERPLPESTVERSPRHHTKGKGKRSKRSKKAKSLGPKNKGSDGLVGLDAFDVAP